MFVAPVAASADNVIEGFSSKQVLQPGMVVALDKATAKTVKPAPADNSNVIYGVVIDPSDAPITLGGQNSQFYVATSGTYQVLVTKANGNIKTGDYLSMSSINGVAAKAKVGQSVILGRAASDFNGTNNVVSNTNGVTLGRILVNITVQKNPLTSADPSLPDYLRRVANGLADKDVPVIRVYTALAIFVVSMIGAVVILWSGVQSSLVSIGRNPLSRKTIFRAMYKVVFTGLGVFIIGLAGVYLLLKV
jgi:hypothetical protein